jgi:hypothetical protein
MIEGRFSMSDRWQRIEALFHAATEVPPEERARFVAAAAGADEQLRAEVESLLASLEDSGDRLREIVMGAADAVAENDPRAVEREAGKLRAGMVLADRFVIERFAGEGGMASVYRARDAHGGPVAIKVLHTGGSTESTERFSREAQILSELKHPGIVDYVAHGQMPDGRSYLAMEWLEGQDLAALLQGGTHLSIDDSVAILAQAADAIASAHRRGIVHRDLKPSNLFLVDNRPDRLKVLDFGIARPVSSSMLTGTGLVLGTPHYMSPEQARGTRQLTPATDVFTLGCVLYECLSGRPPFGTDSLASVLTRVLFDDPESLQEQVPALDPQLAALVEWMLVKDVAARPADAGAVREALARIGDTTVGPRSTRSRTVIDVARGLHGVVLASAPTGAPTNLDALLKGTKVRWEWLLDGTFVASVRGYDSALDVADEAARIAILVKRQWPAADVVLSIGVDASQRAAAMHSAKRGQGSTGVWLDKLAAELLARRFELASEQGEVVLRPGAARVDEDRPLLGRPTACVGREQELGAIEAALVGCVDDAEARAVLVIAGPGLGKSRLRHELLRRVATRHPAPLVLKGTGELASAGAPYGVLRQAVRRLCTIEPGTSVEVARERITAMSGGSAHTACFVGELAGVPFPDDHHPALATARANPQVMQDQIHHATLAFLSAAAGKRPILLVIDDLHWGDALGVALVDYVLREAATTPILVLALARPELHEVFPQIWNGRRLHTLMLPALSRRASERLLTQVLPDGLPPDKIARLVDLSAGNALFLEELARAAAEDPDAPVPKTVIAMIEARIGRLPPSTRQTLLLASVLGRVFARSDLRALAYALVGASDNVDSHLEQLVSAELIARAGAHELSFRHALVRDSTYELLAETERPKIHERAAEVLARGPDPDPIVLAEHWQRSSTPARAIPWLVQAAQAAFARCDLPAAMRLVQRALVLGPVGTVRGMLRAVEGICLGYTGQMPIASLDEALELLPTNDHFWCMACHLRLTLAFMIGQFETVQPLAERFLAAEPTDEAVAEYIAGAGTLSTVCVHAGLPAPAHQLRDRVEAVAARRPELPLVQTWRVWTDACLLDVDGAPAADVLRETERSNDLYRSIANYRNAFFCDGQAALLMANAGDEAGAVARLRQAIEHAQKLDEHYVRVWLSCYLAQLLAFGPAYGEALAITDAIIGMGVAPPGPDIATGVRARALLTAGRIEEAEQSARTALERLAWAPAFAVIPAAALVEALARQGRCDEAILIGERWLASAPPNTSAGARRAALTRALDHARSARTSPT